MPLMLNESLSLIVLHAETALHYPNMPESHYPHPNMQSSICTFTKGDLHSSNSSTSSNTHTLWFVTYKPLKFGKLQTAASPAILIAEQKPKRKYVRKCKVPSLPSPKVIFTSLIMFHFHWLIQALIYR